MVIASETRLVRVFDQTSKLPVEVSLLPAREQELARWVYALRAATADDVRANLSVPLSNPAIRSMLNRLVAKGVLKRELSNRVFIYMPALSCADSGERALRQFVRDHFEGCANKAAETMKELLFRGQR